MGRTRAMLFVCFLFVTFCIAVSLQAQRRFSVPAPPTKNEIERGRYLVEEIAKCAECHTPRKANGELDGQAWLRGAPIWIRPVAPISNWGGRAPALARLPGFTQEQSEEGFEDG